jgi:hypothetical protein
MVCFGFFKEILSYAQADLFYSSRHHHVIRNSPGITSFLHTIVPLLPWLHALELATLTHTHTQRQK